MKTIYQLQEIAARLRSATEVNSISPEDAFGLQSDILEYLADMEQQVEGLGIHKVYTSYAAMVADATAPAGSNGKLLRFGQLVAVYDSANAEQAESGNVYAWQKGNTGASAWLLMGNLGSVLAMQSQIESLGTELLARIKGTSQDSDARTDPFIAPHAVFNNWDPVSSFLDGLMSASGDAAQKYAGRVRLNVNGRLVHVDMYAQDFTNGYWVQVVSGALKIEASGNSISFGASNKFHIYWRRNYDDYTGTIGGEWTEYAPPIDNALSTTSENAVQNKVVKAAVDAEAAARTGNDNNALLASGKHVVIQGVIDGSGQWKDSINGFSDCLVVAVEPEATVVVTYTEEVSLTDRSFFAGFDAVSKNITFADGYRGRVSNNNAVTSMTYTAPEDARFFYTALNRAKIASITVDGKEVFAATPAERLLLAQHSVSLEAASRASADAELLLRIKGTSDNSDARTDPFVAPHAVFNNWAPVSSFLDGLMSASGDAAQKYAGRVRLNVNGRLVHVDMYAQDFTNGYWVQVVNGALKIEASGNSITFGASNKFHIYWRRNYDDYTGTIGGEWTEYAPPIDAVLSDSSENAVQNKVVKAAVDAEAAARTGNDNNALLASGKHVVIQGVIDGNGEWNDSINGFSDCLVVAVEPEATVVVTYTEEVSLTDRSFFAGFDAVSKNIDFATGYRGRVSNNNAATSMTYTAPEDAHFFYTALNRSKIASITVGGKEVFAATPAERLLLAQQSVSALSAQMLRSTDLTLRVGVNLADKANIAAGYVSSGGSLVDSDDWKRISIDVSHLTAGTQLTLGGFFMGRTGYWAFFRGGTASTNKVSNGSFIDPQDRTTPATVTVPEGGADTLYFCIYKAGSSTVPAGWTTAYDEVMCAVGTELPAYVPYNKVVTAIQGHPLAGLSASGTDASGSIVFDLPLSADGTGIDDGYAYINSSTGVVTVKLATQ